MILYLAQHAEAKREEEDPSRDLTEKGRQDSNKMAVHLGKLHLAVSQILHSGKTRALSTANIFAAAVSAAKGVAATTGIAPLDDPQIWAGRIKEMDEDLMLVGHLPHLAKLASLLLMGDEGRNVVNFKMAGLVCLRRQESGQWGVEWMVIPEIL